MNEQLNKEEEFKDNMTPEMYKGLLVIAYEEITILKNTITRIRLKEITLRDKIASHIFGDMLKNATSNEQAAENSYRAADALLRVRESGEAYDPDIIMILKEMRDSTGDMSVFGRAVRTFLTDK